MGTNAPGTQFQLLLICNSFSGLFEEEAFAGLVFSRLNLCALLGKTPADRVLLPLLSAGESLRGVSNEGSVSGFRVSEIYPLLPVVLKGKLQKCIR